MKRIKIDVIKNKKLMKMKNTMMKMMNQQERNSKIRILTNGKISILKKIDQIHNIWI